MTADQRRDIRIAVDKGEREGTIQGYYADAPGDCGVRHHLGVRDHEGFLYELTCNTRAMRILANAILMHEPITHGLVMALRYVR